MRREQIARLRQSGSERLASGRALSTSELAALGECDRSTVIRRMSRAGVSPIREDGGSAGKIWSHEDAKRFWYGEI